VAVLIPKRIKIKPKKKKKKQLINCVFNPENIFPYISTQETNSLKRNLESTSSTSHDQELMEKKNEVEPKRSKRTKT
jgi:hypothetical protein